MIQFDGFDELADDLHAVAAALVQESTLTRAGLGAQRRMQQRRRRGVDVRGSTFQAYSTSHARKRQREGLPTSPVDLKFSQYDSSADALDQAISPDLSTLELLFSDSRASQIAYWHNVSGAGKGRVIREWFALNTEDVDAIQGIIDDDVEQILKLRNLQ